MKPSTVNVPARLPALGERERLQFRPLVALDEFEFRELRALAADAYNMEPYAVCLAELSAFVCELVREATRDGAKVRRLHAQNGSPR